MKTIEVDELKGQQVRARALRAEAAMAGDDSAPLYEGTDQGWVTGKLEVEDAPVGYRRYVVGDYDVDSKTIEPVGHSKVAGPAQRVKGERYIREVRPDGKPRSWQLWEHDGEKYKRIGTAHNHEEKHRFLFPGASEDEIQQRVKFDEDQDAGWRQRRESVRKLAYGEVTAPEVVDTLREADCPVCGNSESFDGEQCKQCFTPETLIRTRDGYIPIASVQPGDEVLGESGSYCRVAEVLVSPWDGLLVEIVPRASVEPIHVTPEHPFLSLVGHHRSKVGRCQPYRCTRTFGSTMVSHHLGWVEAEKIEAGSWLALPHVTEEIEVKAIPIPEHFHGRVDRRGPRSLILTDEALWIIGMYLAEGCAGTRSISFGLHEKEVEYQQRIVDFFTHLGLSTAIKTRGTRGIAVEVYSSLFGEWWPIWLGSGCENKHIPAELMDLPSARISYLLQGILEGDGDCVRGRFGQTSPVLAQQVVEVAVRLGHGPTVSVERQTLKKDVYRLRDAGPEYRQKRRGTWRIGNTLLTEVRSVRLVPYAGDVYNLRVEGDPSYSANGVIVHNCGFKKPPDQYMDPDLDKAKEVDLRGGEEDPTAAGDDLANGPADDLICENCGTTYSSGTAEGGGVSGGVKKVKTIPELPKPDDPDEDAPTPGPGPSDGKVEGDSVPPTSTENLQAGDLCPNCGKGKLVPNDAAGTTDTAADTAEGVFIPPEEVEDEPPKPAEKKAASQKDQSMRPVLAAVADQQKVIEDQAQVIADLIQRTSVLEAQVGTVARLAGVEKELITAGRHAVAKLRSTATKTADVNNPAQPVPAPPSEGPAETTEQTLAPAGRDDVQSIGASPVADVQPDAQTSVDTPDTVLNEPLDLNEESVTAPVAGTEGPLPLDKVKIETDVRVGNPDDPNPAFPLEGPFAQRATTGAKSESRAFASLRLARLRLALGISPDSGISPEGDDLMLGQEISESDMSDELLAHEIGTLSKIVNQARATERRAPRNLVPRSAAAGGQRPPSLRSEAAGEIPQPMPSMAPGVTDEEILFE